MILVLDVLAKEIAQEIGDVNQERLNELKRYVRRTVREITSMMRKGPAYRTASLTVTNGEATMPDNVFAVLRVYDTSVVYQQVDNDTYRSRDLATSSQPTVQIFEDVPNWTMKILNFTSGLSSISIDYLESVANPSSLPDYYEELISWGVKKKYHGSKKGHEDQYSIANTEYTKMLGQFKEQQHMNDKANRRMKGILEVEWQNPANSLLVTGTNDTIGIRGVI
jgi:hypothetical protein